MGNVSTFFRYIKMPSLVHNVPEFIYGLISGISNAFALIAVLYLVKSLFELDFICICEEDHHLDIEYILLDIAFILCPILIIFCIVFCMKKDTLWISKFQCCNCIFNAIIIFIGSAVFWLSAVFLDGDWYVCLQLKNDPQYQNISWKEEKDFTPDERIFFNKHKSTSLVSIHLNSQS